MKRPFIPYTASFTCGAASLAVEIAAGRLLAPFYGQSMVVWAGVIGAVLLFMAAGSVMGGKLADRHGADWPGFGLIPVCAALLSTALSLPLYFLLKILFAGPVLSFSSFTALLFVSLAVFSLPVTLLAALVPAIARILSRGREDAGAVIGRVYAVNTLGSIAGAVASALFLIPLLGVIWGVYLVNCLLAVLSAVYFIGGRARADRRTVLFLAAASALVALSFLPWHAMERASRGNGTVASFDTAYNHVRIFRSHGDLLLAVNDPYFVQSVRYGDGTPRLDAWHLYLLAPMLKGPDGCRSALFLGYGAGTAASLYKKYFPACALTGIEIDPGMVKAGKELLSDDSGARVIIGDARAALYRMNGKYDVIVSDVFRFPYMPHHTVTVEFFRLAKRKLAPGGVMVCNAGRYGADDSLARRIALSMALVFSRVRMLPLGDFNTIIFASDGNPDLAPRKISAGNLAILERYYAAQSVPYVRAPGDGPLYDDVPDTEHITHIMGMRFLASEAFR